MHTNYYYPLSYPSLDYINPCCYLISNCCNAEAPVEHIPIKVDLRPYILPHSWKDPNELPSMSGDRYFLKVFPPYIDNSKGTPRDTPIHNIKVDKYGLYANTALLGLFPSPTRSIKGCYRVEYWRWNKLLVTPSTDLGCRVECGVIKPIKDVTPSSRCLKTEWWYIPRDRYTRCNQPSTHETITMTRRDDDHLPTPNNTDYIPTEIASEILSIKTLSGVPQEFQDGWELTLEEHSGPFDPQIRERVVSRLGIRWHEGPRAGTTYTITYKRPYTIRDIIYQPSYREQELLNINTY